MPLPMFVVRVAKGSAETMYIVPCVKHGGSKVMIWGCTSGLIMGSLVHIEGHMTIMMFRDILENDLILLARRTHGRAVILQQDKHTSKAVKDFIAGKKPRILSWPSQSRDLNPIDHMWQVLKNRLEGESVTNKHNNWHSFNVNRITSDKMRR